MAGASEMAETTKLVGAANYGVEIPHKEYPTEKGHVGYSQP